MSVKRLTLTLILFAALVLPSGAPPALAQPSGPAPAADGSWLPPAGPAAPQGAARSPHSSSPPGAAPLGAIQSPVGDWLMPEGAADRFPAAANPGAAVQPEGGPDDFGYTFSATPLNWIDASGGTNTGLSSSVVGAGPFDIGFPFKYYENTYSQLWVSRHGYLAFNDFYLSRSQSRIPEMGLPNDVIAPHWIPSYDSPNYVRYLRGGSAPNRWFVMEWNRQRSYDGAEFTFQAILYENSTIVFQYGRMYIPTGSSYACQASGIEDSTGSDGLSITNFCQQVTSNQAVRITRPAPSARMRIFPQHYGAFFYPGETSLTQIPVRNTGDLGADVYDIALISPWLALLVHEDGVTALTDTDGDGVVDTGAVPQGQTKTIGIKIWSSPGTLVGYHNTATLAVRSSLDPAKQKTVTSRIAVPTSFAQVFRDDADGAMSMMLVKPQAQTVRKATPDWHWGYDVAVTELPNDNQLYVWSKSRCLDANCTLYGSEVEYAILNAFGETVRPAARLTDHSSATFSTYDYPSGVAVAPDGRVGVVWYRYLWNSSNSQINYNVYWATLDVNGNLATAPANVTNNAVWGASSDLNVPRFYNPKIAATGDYRFVLAWQREHQESAGWAGDIWYAVFNLTGGVVRNPTKLTNGSPGSSVHYTPALASLAPNRTFISWITRRSGNDDVFFAVLDSDGNLAHGVTDLSVDETVTDWNNSDAVQLSDGKILAVWEAWGCFPGEWVARIRYVLLDNTYNRIGTPVCLGKAEAATTGDSSVSVTRGSDHRAVLTWMDRDSRSRRNLYYALVDANGTVVTPPTIFQSSKATAPNIFSSYTGYGNTTYSWTPPAGVDSVLAATPALSYTPPGGLASPIMVKLAGRGGDAATSVRLVATLDPRLSYIGDTSGVTPTVSGQTVTWNLPDLRLFDIRQFEIALQSTGGALGALLPVQFQLTSAEADLTPGDNSATVRVWLSKPVYLPILMR